MSSSEPNDADKVDKDDSSEQPKKKAKLTGRSLFEEQAAESGSDNEDGGDGGADDSDSSEDENEYVMDGFVVPDEEKDSDSDSDDDSDDSGDDSDSDREHGAPRSNLTRLKKRRAVKVADLDDQLLVQDAMAVGVAAGQGKKGTDRASDDGDRDNDSMIDDDNEIEPERVDGGNYGSDNESIDNFIVRDYDENGDGQEDGDGDGAEGGAAAGDGPGADGVGKAGRRRKSDFFSERAGGRDAGGPTREQREDVLAIFGDGFDDFDDFGEDEEEEEDAEEGEGDEEAMGEDGEPGTNAASRRRLEKIRAAFDHTTLVETFCTLSDDVIRATDVPERLQDWLKRRALPPPTAAAGGVLSSPSSSSSSDAPSPQAAQDAALAEEAEWVTRRMVDGLLAASSTTSGRLRCIDDRFNDLSREKLEHELRRPVEAVLRFLLVEHLDVPFIATYRKEHLHPLLVVNRGLWRIMSLDEKWAEFASQRAKLAQELDIFNEISISATAGTFSGDDCGSAEKEEELASLKAQHKALQAEHGSASKVLERLQVDEDWERVEEADRALSAMALKIDQLVERMAAVKKGIAESQKRRRLRDSFDAEAVARTMQLLPFAQYDSVVRQCTDELQLRDTNNYLQLLLKGSEDVTAQRQKLREARAAANAKKEAAAGPLSALAAPIPKKSMRASIYDDDDEDDDSSDYEGEATFKDPAASAAADADAAGGSPKAASSSSSAAPATTAAAPVSLLKKHVQRSTVNNMYHKARQMAGVREFALSFATSAADCGQCLRYGSSFKTECPTPSRPVEELAEEQMRASNQAMAAAAAEGKLAKNFQFKSPTDFIGAVQTVLATELAHEPSVRARARSTYRRYATVSTRPTAKGLDVVTPFHELFGCTYLRNKPLEDLLETRTDKGLFVKLLKAQSDGLLTVTIDPPSEPQAFLSFLMPAYMPSIAPDKDVNPALRQEWDAIRMHVLSLCTSRHLLPGLEAETRRELVRLGREAIVEEATDNFATMLKTGPFRFVPVPAPAANAAPTLDEQGRVVHSAPLLPKYDVARVILDSPNRNTTFSVLCFFFPPKGGGRKDAAPIGAAFLDKDGLVRGQAILPPEAARNALPAFVKEQIAKHRPDVILLNSSGGRAVLALQNQLNRSLIAEVRREEEAELRQRQRERERRNDYGDYDDYHLQPYNAQVLLADDSIARIFKASERAKKQFAEYSPAVWGAISLCRFVQEPLLEYTGLWQSADALGNFGHEALYLDLHPLKSLLHGGARMHLVRSLETALVDVVCHVGVDINMAISYSHYAPLLAFVGGLGLRKADALLRGIRAARMERVTHRKLLLERKILGRCIYTNAAGFLRICHDTASVDEASGRRDRDPLDPLDDTRIHPENYNTNEYAQKICFDALNDGSEKTPRVRRASEAVMTVMDRAHRQLEDVLLHDGLQSAQEAGRNRPKIIEPTMDGWRDWRNVWYNGIRPSDRWSLAKTARTGANVRPDDYFVFTELQDLLYDLELGKWAMTLEREGGGKRSVQFTDLKEELRYPWLDVMRLTTPLGPVSPDTLFEMQTGESFASFHVGQRVNVTVTGLKDKRALVMVDDTIKGVVHISNVSDDTVNDISEHLAPGMVSAAVVLGISRERCTIDVSVRKSHLDRGEGWWLKNRYLDKNMDEWMLESGNRAGADNRAKEDDVDCAGVPTSTSHKPKFAQFDRCFDEQRALERFQQHEDERERALQAELTASDPNIGRANGRAKAGGSVVSGGQVNRVVYHPSFFNINRIEAEDKLRTRSVGEVVFRPSSKGPNNISITWAFQEGVFQHIDVEERRKTAGDFGLGKELYVGDISEPFSDLDEIYSRLIVPMNDFTSTITSHTHFRRGSMSDVEASLKADAAANPARIPYCMHVDPKRPGCFALSWVLKNSSRPLHTMYFAVTADGYMVGRNTYRRPSELINKFKENALAPRPQPPAAPVAQSQQRQPPLGYGQSAYQPPQHQNQNQHQQAMPVQMQMPVYAPAHSAPPAYGYGGPVVPPAPAVPAAAPQRTSRFSSAAPAAGVPAPPNPPQNFYAPPPPGAGVPPPAPVYGQQPPTFNGVPPPLQQPQLMPTGNRLQQATGRKPVPPPPTFQPRPAP